MGKRRVTAQVNFAFLCFVYDTGTETGQHGIMQVYTYIQALMHAYRNKALIVSTIVRHGYMSYTYAFKNGYHVIYPSVSSLFFFYSSC